MPRISLLILAAALASTWLNHWSAELIAVSLGVLGLLIWTAESEARRWEARQRVGGLNR